MIFPPRLWQSHGGRKKTAWNIQAKETPPKCACHRPSLRKPQSPSKSCADRRKHRPADTQHDVQSSGGIGLVLASLGLGNPGARSRPPMAHALNIVMRIGGLCLRRSAQLFGMAMGLAQTPVRCRAHLRRRFFCSVCSRRSFAAACDCHSGGGILTTHASPSVHLGKRSRVMDLHEHSPQFVTEDLTTAVIVSTRM